MGTPFNSSVGTFENPSQIEALKGPQLLKLYNELAPAAPVKRFPDAKAALKRTLAAFATVFEGGTVAAPTRKAPAASKGSSKPGKGSSKASKKAPAAAATGTGVYRKDSQRGMIIELASRPEGATIKALMRKTEWDSAQVRSSLGRIKSYTGLTVDTTGEGDDTIVKITGTLRTRKAFDFQPKAEIKPHQDGTKRAKVLDMLLAKDGASFAEVQKATKWDERTTYEGIRLIHGYLGYGIREDDNGQIHAYVGKAKVLPRPERAAPKPKKAKKAAAAAASE